MKKYAFTLVELLTITAIIAILATILFPVFAKAKASDHDRDGSFRNLERLEDAQQMYYEDHDGSRSGRQNIDDSICEGWRQIIYPYVRSTRTYMDPNNEASDFLDGFSLPGTRASLCGGSQVPLGHLPPLRRGYYWNNVFHLKSINGSNFDNPGMPLSEVEELRTTGDVVEGRNLFDDVSPFSQGWIDNVDATTTWMGSGNPVTGLIGSNLSGKYDGKGQNVAYMDGHVRPTRYIQICDQFANVGADAANCTSNSGIGTGCKSPAPVWRGDPKREGFWNFSEADINATVASTWAQFPNAVAQYCTSLPKANQ